MLCPLTQRLGAYERVCKFRMYEGRNSAHPRGGSESCEEDARSGVTARCSGGGRVVFDHEQLAVERGPILASANCQACDAFDRLQRHVLDWLLQGVCVRVCA